MKGYTNRRNGEREAMNNERCSDERIENDKRKQQLAEGKEYNCHL